MHHCITKTKCYQLSCMKKILIVEDNAAVRENLEEILELSDYDVTTAENGKRGVELAKRVKPDLIICDIMMPDLDGYGVLRILSKKPETAAIPFIFLTAKADKSDFRKGMNLGADDYITKPFEEDDLLQAIETRLKKNEFTKKESESSLAGFNSFIDEAKGLADFNELSENRKEKTYHKKDVIYSEGDFANYLYFIISGKVKSVKLDELGKELVIDMHQAGEFIGYMTLLEDDEYNESAIAMEDVTLAVIPKQDFRTLITKNRDVAIRFIKMLSGSVKEKETRLLQLAYTPVRERTADVLLKLIEKEKEAGSSSQTLKVSREDLANMVGTAKESLIRVLSDFKKAALIESEGTEIRVLDIEGLKHIVQGF